MTNQVNTDALRGLAKWLVGIHVTHSPRLGVGYITKAADELDKLRHAIDDAPHGADCAQGWKEIACDCWKADVL